MHNEREIIFDEALDGSAWPGPLGDVHSSPSSTRSAVAGVQWLGPLGLLDHLETALGLAAPPISTAERVATLAARLRHTEGYWSRSFAADPLGTARHLLAERDALWSAGWRGDAAGARLKALGEVCRGLLGGLPDRVWAVARRLTEPDRDPQLARITLLEQPSNFAACWQQVFERLTARGVTTVIQPLTPAETSGDLAAARAAPFEPTGDGTLLLLRPHGPLLAAEDVAAWIASLPTGERPLIVGADAVLDQALAAQGLPTTGATGDTLATLRVLPLVVALGWRPADPSAAHRLLLLRETPLPRRLARQLCDALSRCPAVGSELWQARLDKGLAAIEDPQQRARTEATVRVIFTPAVPNGGGYPLTVLQRRIDCVRGWATHQAYRSESPWRFEAVVEQCRRLERIIDLAQLAELDEHAGLGNPSDGLGAADLRRLLELATEGLGHGGFGAQAGLSAVSSPEAVCGPARRILWWSFSRDSAPSPLRSRLTRDEQTALAAQGVKLPDPGAEAIRAARRYARPLNQAREQLVFVCPQVGEQAGELHLHPLWDELDARVPPTSPPPGIGRLLANPSQLPGPATRQDSLALPLPTPTRGFQVEAGAIGKREVESPSSLETRLGCPLRWTLRYFGKLSAGLGEPLATDSPLAFGSLAHRLLELLFSEPLPGTPDETAETVGALFDSEGPRLNAALFVPGQETLRDDIRLRLTAAARALHGHLGDCGATVASSEQAYERQAFGSRLCGKPDLVLERPRAVIDFKWGGRARHHDALGGGTALQLAAYSRLTSPDASFAPVGYFILHRPELLASASHSSSLASARRGPFPNATTVNGPALSETWDAAGRSLRAQREQLDAGEVIAAGNPDERGEGVVKTSALGDDKLLSVKAPCEYCEYDLLCGKACEGDA
jgi:ATP-dependent helicase/nuclease subunit B